MKNLEVLIRENKVNPSLQQSYYATVTGQLHGNDDSKTTPMNAEQAAAAQAAQHANEADDEDSGGGGGGAGADDGTYDEDDEGEKKSKGKKGARKQGGRKAKAAAAAAANAPTLSSTQSQLPSASVSAALAAATASKASLDDLGPMYGSATGVLDDAMLPAFPLASQFTTNAQQQQQQQQPADGTAPSSAMSDAVGPSSSRKSQPKIFATITPSSLTIAPTEPNAQPATVTVEGYMDAVMQNQQ